MPKRQQLIANLVSNLVAQEQSDHLEQSDRQRAILSPIRSPEHLVVDLVLVDAFSLSTLILSKWMDTALSQLKCVFSMIFEK